MRGFFSFPLATAEKADAEQRPGLLHRLLGLWLVIITVHLAVVEMVLLPANRTRWLTTILAVGLASSICFVLGRFGRIYLARWLFVIQAWLIVSALAITGGGIQANAVMAYPAILVAAGMLLGKRAGLITALLCVATEWTMVYLGTAGLLPPNAVQSTVFTIGANHTLFAFLFLILLDLATRDAENALKTANQELGRRIDAEDALLESEQRAQHFVQATFEGIALSEQGRIIEVNAQFATMLQYEPADLVGKPVWDLVVPESVSTVMQRISTACETPYEHLILRKDGSTLPVEVRGRVIRYSGRNARITVVRDLTERKQAEEALRKSEEKFSKVFRSAPTGIALSTVGEGRFLEVNVEFESLFGYSREEVISRTSRELGIWVDPEERERLRANLQNQGTVKDREVRVYNRNKDLLTLRYSADLIELDGTSYLLSVFIDVTDRKRAEVALRRAEDLFRGIVEDQTEMIVRWKPDGTRTFVNQAYCRALGKSYDELVGSQFDPLVTAPYRESVRHKIQNLTAAAPVTDGVYEVILPNGRMCWQEWTDRGLFNERGELIELQSVGRDITERKRVEIALSESETKFSKAFHASPVAMVVARISDGRIVDVNESFALMFGYNSKEMIGQVFPELGFLPDGQARESRIAPARSRGQVRNREVSVALRSGDSRTCLLSSEDVDILDQPCTLITAIDITERRRAEEQRLSLERQLVVSQKLESLGTLSGGIAHDFNNILAIIQGHASLHNPFSEPEKVSESMEAIIKASKRGSALVRQLLTFARKSEVVFEDIDANSSVSEVTKLLKQTFPKTIDITTELQPGLPSIEADSTQIHQVLINLCVNARDAMPKGGALHIRTATADGITLASRHPDASPRQYAVIEIADTGTGMDESTRLRIFEPFFTTKDIGKGTGLGLSLVHSIVTSHSGFIDVETEIGVGTTFRIFLPAGEQRIRSGPPSREGTHSSPAGTGTILVIEDEEMLAELVKAVLAYKGYKVLTAKDGEGGVEMFARHHKEISAVICDLGLPKLTGDEVYMRIRAIDPAARVALASGYIDPRVKSELQTAGARHFLQKPYLPEQLLRILGELIGVE